VAVSNVAPGSVKRLSVAVALNQDALKGAKAADIATFEKLIGAAVGADINRGDTVAVVVRPFQAAEKQAKPFLQNRWLATKQRYSV
jgi:flagellar M-ring protein FliF